MIRVFIVALSLWCMAFSPVANAADPVPITWTASGIWTGAGGSGGMSPTQFCSSGAQGMAAALVQASYGYPTTFRCIFNDGTTNSFRDTMPSCPTGYIVDFEKQMCLPTNSTFEQLLSLPIPDAQTLAIAIAALWASAWGWRQLASIFSVRDNEDET